MGSDGMDRQTCHEIRIASTAANIGPLDEYGGNVHAVTSVLGGHRLLVVRRDGGVASHCYFLR